MSPRPKNPDRKNCQVHMVLHKEVYNKLQSYAKEHGKSVTAIMEHALSLLFDTESLNPVRDRAIKEVVSRRFAIPRGFTPRSFWLSLYMLASRYPEGSSKLYWGEEIYLSIADKTHYKVFEDIKDEVTIEINRTNKYETSSS